MRHVMIAVAMLGALALAGSAAMAQDGPPAGGGQPGARPGRGGAGPFAQLDLTADQKTKIEAIMKGAREKAAAAETPQAKQEIRKAAMEDIRKNVLTADQVKKLETMRANRPFGGPPFGELGLTPEQKAKVEEILKAAKANAEKAQTPKEKGEIIHAAVEDIKKNVLTADQLKKLAELPGPGERMIMRRLEQVNLTDEQKAKVKGILTAAKAGAEKADGFEGKRAVLTAAMDDIKKNVLTEEQRKKLESLPGPGARGGRRGAGGTGTPPPAPAGQ